MFSRNVENLPALSILMTRFALISEKITLPSGNAIGPSVPLSPSFSSCTFVPPLTTPGMSGATVSVAGGSGAAPRPCAATSIEPAHIAIARVTVVNLMPSILIEACRSIHG